MSERNKFVRRIKMSNKVTTPPDGPQADDGFSVSSRSQRVGRGSYLKWNDKQGWIDRDGVAAPSPLLAVGVDEFLRRFKNNVAEYIVEKPLPDPNELNAAIPIQEWEAGVDGKPRPPWAHTVAVFTVNLLTGETYTYAAATVGAHIAHDALKEAVITMRALRGTRCMPVVNLADRPMKMKFGQGKRPHFAIIGWRTPGEDANAIPARPTAPQLPGPAAAETLPASTMTAAASSITSGPAQQAQPQEPRQAKPKPPIDVTGETLATMSDVKPITTGEIFDDDIPW
jgi:hypothetical protein